MDAPAGNPQVDSKTLALALIPLGIALNLAIGTIIQTLKVPVYLDAVGTIAVTLLAGVRAGMLVGVLSFLLGGLLVNPVLPWFSGTQAAIALYVGWAASKGFLRNIRTSVAAGIGLGVVAAIVSAPVIVALFGGITGSGASLVVAFLLASGKSVLQSVVLSGLAAEPLDKTLQVLLALWLLRGVPKSLLERFRNERLTKNGLLV
jgi:energy-coupling factor transport system substrate-specific component